MRVFYSFNDTYYWYFSNISTLFISNPNYICTNVKNILSNDCSFNRKRVLQKKRKSSFFGNRHFYHPHGYSSKTTLSQRTTLQLSRITLPLANSETSETKVFLPTFFLSINIKTMGVYPFLSSIGIRELAIKKLSKNYCKKNFALISTFVKKWML